jgi:hypothetical protein
MFHIETYLITLGGINKEEIILQSNVNKIW